jgi:hypothetical protein
VICETKCIWSHYLLLDREKGLPNLVPSPCRGARPLQPIDATPPWQGFVEQITLLRGIGRQPLQQQSPAYRVLQQPKGKESEEDSSSGRRPRCLSVEAATGSLQEGRGCAFLKRSNRERSSTEPRPSS